jgi:predicted Zn-dependent protease
VKLVSPRFYGLALLVLLSLQNPSCDEALDFIGAGNAEDSARHSAYINKLVAEQAKKEQALRDAQEAVRTHNVSLMDKAIAGYPDKVDLKLQRAAMLMAEGRVAEANRDVASAKRNMPSDSYFAHSYALMLQDVRNSYPPNTPQFARMQTLTCDQLAVFLQIKPANQIHVGVDGC